MRSNMERHVRNPRARRACLVLALLLAPPGHAQTAVEGEPTAVERAVAQRTSSGTPAGGAGCLFHEDCNDGRPCTLDLCTLDHACVHLDIPDCKSCGPRQICPLIDLVFVMDTSGSMRDEAAALCDAIDSFEPGLQAAGIDASVWVLGISETPEFSFVCVTDNVVNLLGSTVPGDSDTCPFPGGSSAFESWGPATAIVADRFPWGPGVRIIVPISDEAACDGDLPEGCNDPGDDRDSVLNAITVAGQASVIVSPMAGTNASACTIGLMQSLAEGTGGQAFQTEDPQLDFADAIRRIVFSLCTTDLSCDDENPCTSDDQCIDGSCLGIEIVDCVPCDDASQCDDADGCTDDDCAEGICAHAVDCAAELQISIPGNVTASAQCNRETAVVNWMPPRMTNACSDAVLSCTGQHESGKRFDALALGGGTLPVGLTTFCCAAVSGRCENTLEKCWTVRIDGTTEMEIEIALSPTQQGQPGRQLTRCIKFTLYPNTVQEPLRFERDVMFGEYFEFPGESRDVITIPRVGQWQCITAWDHLHTLRSCYELESDDCVGGWLRAKFSRDPAFGGNWLIGGNLDGWKKDLVGSEASPFAIDILDYGTLLAHWGANYGTPHTPCGTPGPNADINGDGLVGLEDYAFININFLRSAADCCGVDGLPAGAAVLTQVSVRDLRLGGLGELAAGDLNADGLLNVEDMNAFARGVRPGDKGIRGIRKGAAPR